MKLLSRKYEDKLKINYLFKSKRLQQGHVKKKMKRKKKKKKLGIQFGIFSFFPATYKDFH